MSEISEILQSTREKENEEARERRVASPYTKTVAEKKDKLNILIMIAVSVLVLLIIIWSISQITG